LREDDNCDATDTDTGMDRPAAKGVDITMDVCEIRVTAVDEIALLLT